MSDGGYDDGYLQCPVFWGDEPAAHVKTVANHVHQSGYTTAVDLGCGDGKNAAALARAGLRVLALDKSRLAVENARKRFPHEPIMWLVCDMQSVAGPANAFDVVVASGSLHCLPSKAAISSALDIIKSITKPGGVNIVSAFDDGPQDMSGHSDTFRPTFASHEFYLAAYADWKVIEASSVVQPDRHPHNEMEHSHSITRILAMKPA